MKKDWLTILILAATVILAIIAVVTAIRLYQIGKEPVAPTAPKPAPAVAIPSPEPTPVPVCTLEFDIMGTTPTLTVTPPPTPTTTPTSTPTATPAAEATVTPTPILLPEVGIVFPTWTLGLAGVVLLLFGLLFTF